MDQKKLLILGGYGITGSLVARLLLQETDAQLWLAGRSQKKADGLALELNNRYGAVRVMGQAVDASNPDSLRLAFQGMDMVVVASSTAKYASLVASAALEAGIDYLDVQYSTQKIAELKACAAEIERRGRCFITEGGFHPGVPGALVRYAIGRFDHLIKAIVGSAIKIDWMTLPLTPSTVDEMVEEFSSAEMLNFTKGQWKKVNWWGMADLITMDFAPYFKRQYCVPMFLEEMRSLPDMAPDLQEMGFFVSGFNWFVDWLIFPIVILGVKIAPARALRPMGNLLLWGLRNFTKPPYGTLLRLEASGLVSGLERSLQVQCYHPDGYMFTAIPTVACLLQVLDGTARKPGLRYQAHVVEPERFLKDMERMGVSITVRFS